MCRGKSVCFKPNFGSRRGEWHTLWLVRRLSAGAKNPEECERGAVEMLGLSQLIAFILLPCLAFLVTSTLFELLWLFFCLVWLLGHHRRFGAFKHFAKRGVYIQISNSLNWDHILYEFLYPTLDFTKAKLTKCRNPLHAYMTYKRLEGSLSVLAKLIVWNNANKLWGVMFNNCHSRVAGSSGYKLKGILCFFIACYRWLQELLQKKLHWPHL